MIVTFEDGELVFETRPRVLPDKFVWEFEGVEFNDPFEGIAESFGGWLARAKRDRDEQADLWTYGTEAESATWDDEVKGFVVELDDQESALVAGLAQGLLLVRDATKDALKDSVATLEEELARLAEPVKKTIKRFKEFDDAIAQFQAATAALESSVVARAVAAEAEPGPDVEEWLDHRAACRTHFARPPKRLGGPRPARGRRAPRRTQHRGRR